MQCGMMHQGLSSCLTKCMDLTDLYTDKRTEMPTRERLKVDKTEKDCVVHCSAKWDELFKREIMQLNKKEIQIVQMEAFMKMQAQAMGTDTIIMPGGESRVGLPYPKPE